MANPQLLEKVRELFINGKNEADIHAALSSEWNTEEVTGAIATLKLEQMHSGTPMADAQIPGAPVFSGAPASVSVTQGTSSMWTRIIPGTNMGFLVITMLLVFGLDLVILVTSPELWMYWAEMVGVFAVFMLFFWFENSNRKKAYGSSRSALDGWILFLIVVRNICVVLNSIPFIQLLGGFLLFFGIIPYLILYTILIDMRTRATAQPI